MIKTKDIQHLSEDAVNGFMVAATFGFRNQIKEELDLVRGEMKYQYCLDRIREFPNFIESFGAPLKIDVHQQRLALLAWAEYHTANQWVSPEGKHQR